MVKALSLLFVLWASQVFAAWPHDCVCDVSCVFQNPTQDRYAAGGSATLIAVNKANGHGLLISAWHVFSEGNLNRISVKFPTDEKRLPAKLLGRLEKADLAALDIPNVPKLKLPKAIKAAKKEDGPFTAVGYPWDANDQQQWNKGNFLGYPNYVGQNHEEGMVLTTNLVRSGYSGGARFNRFGEYVGPISGMTGKDRDHMDKCYGASGPVLTQFVGQFVKDIK